MKALLYLTRIWVQTQLLCLSLATGVTCPNGLQWQPENMPKRDDLCCNTWKCNKGNKVLTVKSEEFDNCCTCYSFTSWEDGEVNLGIEYISVSGKSLVINENEFDENSTYMIKHRYGEMTEIPSNFCDWDPDSRLHGMFSAYMLKLKYYWPRIVKLDLQGNKIRQIRNLTCISHLDTIDLSYNRISKLTNNSINKLSFLRKIDLSHNEIKTMEPYFLSQSTQNIFLADISNNQLPVLDVSNMISLFPFCSIDYTSNVIEHLVNELDFTLDPGKHYGPGFVHLSENAIQQFPDFADLLNLESLQQLGQLISFGFDLREIDLVCDCNFEPFRGLAIAIKETLWHDYMNITCKSPDNLKGRTAIGVNPLLLNCTLEREDNCPRNCKCVDQPYTNTVYVDCSDLALREMPENLPNSTFSAYIHLNLSNNNITELKDTNYLHKLTVLDLSTNHLKDFSNGMANKLENVTLIISDNPYLLKIPQQFQHRNICKTEMENVYIDCGCEMVWMEEWLKTKSCVGEKLFYCHVPKHGQVFSRDFSADLLDCRPNVFFFHMILTFIAVIIGVLSLAAALVYKFWYDIYILWKRLKQKRINKHLPEFTYDVAITFNEEDDQLRKWVINVLVRGLAKIGYKVFLPFRDVPFGNERDGEIIKTFCETRSFLLILSESYLHESEDNDAGRSWTENEWKYAWHQFKSDHRKNIVLLNYDYISSLDVSHRQIAAFLRVGCVVQFGNHGNNLISEVISKIGPHCGYLPAKSLGNKEPVLDRATRNNQRNHLSSSVGSFSSLKIVPIENFDSKKEPKSGNHLDLLFNVQEQERNEKPKFVRECCKHKLQQVNNLDK